MNILSGIEHAVYKTCKYVPLQRRWDPRRAACGARHTKNDIGGSRPYDVGAVPLPLPTSCIITNRLRPARLVHLPLSALSFRSGCHEHSGNLMDHEDKYFMLRVGCADIQIDTAGVRSSLGHKPRVMRVEPCRHPCVSLLYGIHLVYARIDNRLTHLSQLAY